MHVDRQQLQRYLRQVPLFSRLSNDDLDALCAVGDVVRFAPDEDLMREGDDGDCAYILLQGDVVITQGKFTLNQRHTGAFIGEVALLDEGERTATVTAINHVTAMRFDREPFETLFSRPSFTRGLLRALSHKTRELVQQRVEELTTAESLRDNFARYVSGAVLSEIMSHQDPEELLAGNITEATILFTDIRGFSTLSETLSPEDLIDLLRDYLNRMIDIVMRHHGFINKFIGDALLVLYNLPLPRADAVASAAQTALDMCQAVINMNQDRVSAGKPPVAVGVALHSGQVIAGNIGNLQRMEYTVMGDNVNLCSRLEGLTKHYQVNVIISGETQSQLPPDTFITRPLDIVIVKGRNEPTWIYELVARTTTLPPDKKLFYDQFNQAFTAYQQQNWDQCLTILNQPQYAHDHPAHILRQHCHNYQKNPPPADWHGARVMTVK
ncbi:MAG TPA: adenylate/guanylate cyclase domain-containing protein [Anaerolineae bacterium]|nr:adenylate/guanylate cyclase domain-containing protein [Anaerolineae bacterium]